MPRFFKEELEWEFFNSEEEFHISEIKDVNLDGVDSIKIWRDESYKLRLSIKGQTKNPSCLSKLENKIHGEIGTRVKPLSFSMTTDKLEKYTFPYTYLSQLNRSPHLHGFTKYCISLKPFKIEMHPGLDHDVLMLTDWFLNGPKEYAIFPDGTEREAETKYLRNRSCDHEFSYSDGKLSHASSSDCCRIKTDKLDFIIFKSPNNISPEWSMKIGIEYPKTMLEQLTDDLREAISELTSFLMGRQLLLVGTTKYDKIGQIIHSSGRDPWGDNIVRLCQSSTVSPIRYHHGNWGLFKKLLTNHLDQYLEYREVLSLKDVIWRYWLSRTLPLGLNVPILASAIEVLADRWAKSNLSKLKNTYMDSEVYRNLISDEVEVIRKKLSKQVHVDKMINKINGAFQVGSNEKLNNFLDEIGINLGNLEKKAIKSRNKYIHSALSDDPIKIKEMSLMARVYETLFHRVFLKILGYDGEIINRSYDRWPDKHIDVPSE